VYYHSKLCTYSVLYAARTSHRQPKTNNTVLYTTLNTLYVIVRRKGEELFIYLSKVIMSMSMSMSMIQQQQHQQRRQHDNNNHSINNKRNSNNNNNNNNKNYKLKLLFHILVLFCTYNIIFSLYSISSDSSSSSYYGDPPSRSSSLLRRC
jgi:hypothetical protein